MTINPKTRIGEVIKIVALETGYYKTNVKETQEFLDTFNRIQLKVSRSESRAMETASMFGWDTYLSSLESYMALDEKSKLNAVSDD